MTQLHLTVDKDWLRKRVVDLGLKHYYSLPSSDTSNWKSLHHFMSDIEDAILAGNTVLITSSKYHFYNRDSSIPEDLAIAMIDASEELEIDEFLGVVHQPDLRVLFPQFDWHDINCLEIDLHLAFFKSTYDEQPCVYIETSACAYIFLKKKPS